MWVRRHVMIDSSKLSVDVVTILTELKKKDLISIRIVGTKIVVARWNTSQKSLNDMILIQDSLTYESKTKN